MFERIKDFNKKYNKLLKVSGVVSILVIEFSIRKKMEEKYILSTFKETELANKD